MPDSPDSNDAADVIAELVCTLRQLRHDTINRALRGGQPGSRRRAETADLVERAMVEVWGHAITSAPVLEVAGARFGRRPARNGGFGPGSGVALAAVGSLARRETGPLSDLDLVLVHDGRRDASEIAELADQVWYPLWDSGIRLDHSVRTPAQCREVAATDAAAGIGLLDLRPLAGDLDLVIRARAQLLADWRGGIRKRLPRLLDVLSDRVERFGEVAHALEPDLKQARGGLRDVTVLRALAASWVTDRPHGAVDAAAEELLDVRDMLHAVAGRPTDRLLLSDQDAVAAGLRLADADELLANVCAAGRIVAQAVDVTVRRARMSLPGRRMGLRPGPRRPLLRPLGNGVVEHDGEAVLGTGVRPAGDPVLPLTVATRAVQAGLPVSPVTVENLAAEAPPLPVPWPEPARAALFELLSAGEALPAVWESYDLAGLITKWFPEWAGVRNRPQRNAVHRHTVDRHLVQTVVEASRSVRDVARPDLLLFAAMVHDIGKLPGAQDHSLTGAPIAAGLARRIGLPAEDVAVIERLVREHLTLIELATRRDPDDPRTVQALVQAVDGSGDVLDLLRALTEADARAVGPVAWTPWRTRLVDDLVRRTRSALRGEAPPGPAPISESEQLLIDAVITDGRPHVAIATFHDLYAVSVVAPDRPGLFAEIAGTLAAHRLSVKSALVRTIPVTDGGTAWGSAGSGRHMAVDTWYVDAGASPMPEPSTLETDLRRLAEGDRTVLDRLHRRDAGYRPMISALAQPRVVLLPGASQEMTVIEVRAADRPGLLHALGEALTAAGADLRSAHVATYAGQAVDVLYVGEPHGARLSPARVGSVIAELVDAAELAGVRSGLSAGPGRVGSVIR